MMKAKPKNWTHEEQVLALNLYHILPFGRLDKKTPEIIALSKVMGRTASSLSMKLCNFASLDPEITKNGRVGLKNIAQKDREIWQWHLENPAEFNKTYEILITRFELEDEPIFEDVSKQLIGRDKVVFTKARIGQGVFRRMILDAYGSSCCITGLNIKSMLVASHIKPWRDDEAQRMNPKNGLCLSSIHDRAFDQGMLTISDNGEVILSSEIKENTCEFVIENFHKYEGKELNIKNDFSPDFKFLKYHRERIFRG
ncbi:MAG: restriction endonuclease [Oceanospirillaceae bacterium]|uniref:HNH endonuclease n=1 Tax=unclassified Thalassolituus TaxID=2624967 RepID=UPI000C4599CA|nr:MULTISPECIES: HNH endonuclease [unclassified Thalassolituus]MAS25042.1 restriction endonuclease [Oceanospirillaceae bacterium]MAX98584.1 restriction endonuclease [Oceanospirillaceae bacterium]MBL34345.1 restriction endonuclease [Oceanospirillaceae bacterium]MBS51832.1 restriction endonuclease [Oceanospirillaceae bacterium]|tara:strand:+ start:620 stop:1384 length:765 start_codon:yes stop_codon:yes gene_type:complete